MRKKHRIYSWGILLLGLSVLLVSCAKESPNKLSSELLLVEGNPLVSFRILLKVGSAHDAQGKEGLCQLTCSLLANGGTKDANLSGGSGMIPNRPFLLAKAD